MNDNCLQHWDEKFTKVICQISQSNKVKAGALLPVLPDRLLWDEYVQCIRKHWNIWRDNLQHYPSSLVTLYAGIAFFEYEGGSFWPSFAKVVGAESIPVNQQTAINDCFGNAIINFGLTLRKHVGGTDFVGSAVYSIGIPLSLWAAFLEICEWALWQKDWKLLPQNEWEEIISKRTGSRLRLRRFLSESRDTTTALITEILEAREFLASKPDLTIKDIATVSILLRPEYFDEVDDTADFLRPQNPETLFANRPRVVFDENRRTISLQLPGVKPERLPATWRVGSHVEAAASTPHELTLDSAAFCDSIQLAFNSQDQDEVQRISGIRSWALFDMENGGCIVNSNRDELRLKSYAFVSRERMELSREGFETEDAISNQKFELTDGTTCHITRLWPTGRYPELKVREGTQSERVIHFKTRNRIEVQFFVGWGRKSAYFYREQGGILGIDHLPIPCVAIPNGYFRDNQKALAQIFHVTIDDHIASGQWHRLPTPAADKEFWEWIWSRKPLLERIPGNNHFTSFSELGSAFKSVDLGGMHTFAIKTGEIIRDLIKVNIIDRSKNSIDDCWKYLPGSMLPLFLLSQSQTGMKWEELLLAKDVVAPDLTLSRYILHKYILNGIVTLKGNRWLIRESRAELRSVNDTKLIVRFCGDPSIIWGFYRYVSSRAQDVNLPCIEVVDKRGDIPFMSMYWQPNARGVITSYLRRQNVILGKILCNQ